MLDVFVERPMSPSYVSKRTLIGSLLLMALPQTGQLVKSVLLIVAPSLAAQLSIVRRYIFTTSEQSKTIFGALRIMRFYKVCAQCLRCRYCARASQSAQLGFAVPRFSRSLINKSHF